MIRSFKLLGLIAILASIGLGCQNVGGLCAARKKPRPDDPSYTIDEQKRRARDKYALPDDDFRTGPPLYNERPGGIGR